jgi:hypothetical protein
MMFIYWIKIKDSDILENIRISFRIILRIRHIISTTLGLNALRGQGLKV